MDAAVPVQCQHKSVFKKKFPTKKLVKLIDSNIKNSGDLECDKQNCPQRQKIPAWSKILKWGLPTIVIVRKSINNKKVDVVHNSTYRIRISHRFLY